ncbi:S-layer homology domain-containing protein [Cytobacillus sp. IB215316]|uniref:S-layer homology domain-containing protein n=1 Tax=Cytobacillus sp. IB215316 TaxID=3097354 RepID=UPI002A10A63B|nr:S-layer homology domain-containing protein [Cytobacillus sp. IB215316]MDX8361144.1 S-layer homology domain-containing protein [Cytobacillus sp. IB215316]
MKNLLRLFVISCVFMLAYTLDVEAAVFDETKTTTAAQFQYEDYYTLMQSYTGDSGVTIESYSSKWKTEEQLIEVEQELLRNKHGEELELLGKVVLLPDYPAGDETLGQYFALYELRGTKWSLLPDRKIYLYGVDDFATVPEIAQTLSHEYGHHFTFYHLIEGENLEPDEWMKSNYAEVRSLSTNHKAHSDGSGDYVWGLAEILAEDYVQLFGTELAIMDHAQLNGIIQTPFDNVNIQEYWREVLNSSEYEVREPMDLYLLDYEKNMRDRSYYNLQFHTSSISNNPIFLIGQDGEGIYKPITIGTIETSSPSASWYSPSELQANLSWVFDSYTFKRVKFITRQHEEVGFNRGSESLRITYNNIEESKITNEQLNLQNSLTFLEKKQLLSEIANEYRIPAEVLKAIAYVETGMMQFDDDGHPIISENGGLGMMQIRLSDEEMNERGIDRHQLETDTRYNVEVAAQLLNEYWESSKLPKINEHDRSIIEDWYFTIMAYDGLTKQNDPHIEHEQAPYQERVFEAIREHSLVDVQQIPPFDVVYDDTNAPEQLSFPTMSYQWDGLMTQTAQPLSNGDLVYTNNAHASYSEFSDELDGDTVKNVFDYTPLQIIAGPFENNDPAIHYVYYEVLGNEMGGYIASVNVHKGNVTIFPDIEDDDLAAAVSYLHMNEVINGYEDGTFKPNHTLLRRHAAVIIVRALDLKLPEGYEVKATDMNIGDLGYEAMAIAEANGLMGVGGKLRPNEYLTRSQIVSILARAYTDKYIPATTNKIFTDVDEAYWNYEDINLLANNGIIPEQTFRPADDITRAEFALYVMRTMLLE